MFLYGNESWTLDSCPEKKLGSLHRHVLWTYWMEKVLNTQVFKQVGIPSMQTCFIQSVASLTAGACPQNGWWEALPGHLHGELASGKRPAVCKCHLGALAALLPSAPGKPLHKTTPAGNSSYGQVSVNSYYYLVIITESFGFETDSFGTAHQQAKETEMRLFHNKFPQGEKYKVQHSLFPPLTKQA